MSTTAIPVDRNRGFLVIPAGGTGAKAAVPFHRAHQAEGQPFAKLLLATDTEPGVLPEADLSLPLEMSDDQLAALVADPAAVAPVAERIVAHYPQFLLPEAAHHGSRTTRLITQLYFAAQTIAVVEMLKRAVRTLVKQCGVRTVLPVLFGSTGGGAGSALIILLAMTFANRRWRALITEGLSPHVLDMPVAVVAEPFAFALKHRPKHANKILANAFAFRLESALLESQGCFQYVFHQGLANDGGAVLDTEEEIAKVLGMSVYQLCRNWAYIKARFVDTVETGKVSDRYQGIDTPEYVIPPEEHPVYASALRPRTLIHRELMPNGQAH